MSESAATQKGESNNNGELDVRDYDKQKFSTVTEGLAEILYPKENKVFYNPVQQFNRDLSTIGIRAWTALHSEGKKKKRSADGEAKPFIDIIEALSATGLRAIRYAKEIPQVRTIWANDISKDAVDAIRLNVEHNKVEDIVKPNQDDATILMYKRKTEGKAHVVDLDPYGSAAPFIDAAVQSVIDGGLLLVTCTDLAILAGNSYPEKCFAFYGGTTVHNDACKESALRLVLNMVAQAAARYGRSIEPLGSFSIDFYVRCFIRIKSSPVNVKFNHSRTMVVYHCHGCNAATPQYLGKASQRRDNPNVTKFSLAQASTIPGDKCEHCGSHVHIAGPMWGGQLHDEAFLNKVLEIQAQESSKPDSQFGTLQRIEGMATMAKQELKVDAPLFFSLPGISRIVKMPCPPTTIVASALLNAGYRVSETHIERSCIKTDAPWSMIWNIARAWAKQEKGEEDFKKNIKESSPGYTILDKNDPFIDVNFNFHEDAKEFEKSKKSKLVRYQMNPTENWGPKARAG